jgi:biopolymer transport protein ExbD
MADLNPSPAKSRGKRSVQRMPLRVDLTAMVDLAFLLITFFMLTTSLSKLRIMPVAVPDKDTKPTGDPETRTMSLCLGKNNRLIWYLGMPEKPLTVPKQIGYGTDLKKAVKELSDKIFKASGKDIIVLVKPSDHSVYANLVETFDELNNQQVQTYSLAGIAPKDVERLKQVGIY